MCSLSYRKPALTKTVIWLPGKINVTLEYFSNQLLPLQSVIATFQVMSVIFFAIYIFASCYICSYSKCLIDMSENEKYTYMVPLALRHRLHLAST